MNSKVADVRNLKLKSYLQETYNSFSPLTWLLNLLAINCNIKTDNYSKCFHISKCCLMLGLFVILTVNSLYYKYTLIYHHTSISPSIRITDTVQMIYDLCQYIVDLWLVSKYGKNISLEYIKQYSYIDEILDMTHSYYSKIKWKLVKLIGIFTLIWLTSSACDYAAWFYSYGWITPTVYGIAYIFLYIKILTTLDLSSHVMHIEIRLKIIGDIIQHYYSVADVYRGFTVDFICNKNDWLYSEAYSPTSEFKQRSYSIKLQSTDEGTKVKRFTKCYLQLTEQVEFINCMFGFRILLNSLSLLIDIIRFTNIAVRIMLGSQMMPNNERYFPALSSLMRQMTCVLVLINLVTHCEKAYRQRDRIINTIDHLLINKNPSEKLREAVTELRDLLQARPINFTVAKFFRLDNSFLVSIASVVVTYTIILLQAVN